MFFVKSVLELIHFYGHSGCWAAGANNQDQWIAVELNSTFQISGIQIQSRRHSSQMVKTFELMHSMDGENWVTYADANGDKVN